MNITLLMKLPRVIASQILSRTIDHQYCKKTRLEFRVVSSFQVTEDMRKLTSMVAPEQEDSQVFQTDVKEASMLLALRYGNRTFDVLVFVQFNRFK
jgi:hypothetical protein